MLRIVLGVIGGFIGWMVLFIGIEKIISAVWPAFGGNQKAFEDAIKNGAGSSGFTADTTMLLTQLAMGVLASLLAGYLAALVAGENSKAPLIAGCLLLLVGIAKAAMSWQYVPVWYHIVFTVMLLPMAIVGGKLITTTS